MSRHKVERTGWQRIGRFFAQLGHILMLVFTYGLLFVGAVIVGWGFAYTTMYGLWWLVPVLAIVLAPPTAITMVKWQKRRRFRKGQKAVLHRYGVKV
jgi:hypothetical protein